MEKRKSIRYGCDFSIGYTDGEWDIKSNGNNIIPSENYMNDSGAFDRQAYKDGWKAAMDNYDNNGIVV